MKIVNKVVSMFLLLATTQASAGGFEAREPWIREAPPGMQMLAGYMLLENQKSDSVNLVSASSADFKAIEIHQSVLKDDVATMIQRQSVNILPYSSEKFEPNGLHLMLIGPKRDLVEGDKVKVVLKFSNYRKMKVIFPVRKGGGVQHH